MSHKCQAATPKSVQKCTKIPPKEKEEANCGEDPKPYSLCSAHAHSIKQAKNDIPYDAIFDNIILLKKRYDGEVFNADFDGDEVNFHIPKEFTTVPSIEQKIGRAVRMNSHQPEPAKKEVPKDGRRTSEMERDAATAMLTLGEDEEDSSDEMPPLLPVELPSIDNMSVVRSMFMDEIENDNLDFMVKDCIVGIASCVYGQAVQNGSSKTDAWLKAIKELGNLEKEHADSRSGSNDFESRQFYDNQRKLEKSHSKLVASGYQDIDAIVENYNQICYSMPTGMKDTLVLLAKVTYLLEMEERSGDPKTAYEKGLHAIGDSLMKTN